MLERRTFLSGLASLPLVAAAGPALAGSDISALWHEFQLAKGTETLAADALAAANAHLPWWAKPGPSYVDHLGVFSGFCGWPAIENYTLPKHEGSFHLIRIGKPEIDKRFEGRRLMIGETRAQAIREKEQAELNQRLARLDAEREGLDIPALEGVHEKTFEVMADLGDIIGNLPDGPIDVAAAKILIELRRAALDSETANSSDLVGLAVVALRGLLPHLHGELAVDVADAIQDPDRTVPEMRFSRGLLASGEVAGSARTLAAAI